MIGQKDSGVFVRVLCDLERESFIARAKIRNQRQLSDPHDKIRGDRRDAAGRVEPIETGNRGRVTAVEMDDGAALMAFLVHREMEKIFFAGLGTGNKISVPIQLGETGRIELSKARVGGRQ